MKKFIVMVIVAMMASTTVFAQSSIELAKQQRELNEFNMKIMNAKPSKDAKKQGKLLRKQGWLVTGSGKSIEQQITSDQLLAEELMADLSGNPMRRYIQHSTTAVQGTLNAAYGAARLGCQVEIAAMIETKIAGAMQQKIDGSQSSAISSTTVDKFHQRAKAIFDTVITNAIPGLSIYRVLPNYSYEVEITLSFDKKQVAERLTKELQRQLEIEGDEELNSIVDQALQEL